MSVKLQDNSIQVQAALNDTTIAWLYEWANEIASHAKDNVELDGEAGDELRKSYRADIDTKEGKATIGTSLEAGYWEEFGTGEHADTGKNGGIQGRKGWWVYVKGGSGYDGETNVYATKEEAESAAAFIERKYGVTAVATNGRDPNYTLEKAFDANRKKAEADLQKKLKGMK